VVNLLPFPEKVTRNVVLIGKEVEIRVKLPKDIAVDSPRGLSARSEADEAARQGLPQGSPASGLIVRRAVLGPLLAQLPFSEDIALYQDEVAVPTKTQAEAGAVRETLKVKLATSPVGPLTIREEDQDGIFHTSEGAEQAQAVPAGQGTAEEGEVVGRACAFECATRTSRLLKKSS
jgi:hypothetical protein